MRLSEYKDIIKEINDVFNKTNRESQVDIFRALLDIFPRQVPPQEQFNTVYHPELSARQLVRALFPPKKYTNNPQLPTPTGINARYGNRKDPIETRRPCRKVRNWREHFDDPTCVLLDSIGDTKLCDMMGKDSRKRYEATGNVLFVLQAFFRRVDQLTGALSEIELQCAKPEKNAYSLDDGGGLHLVVNPDGTKQWYLKICRKIKTRKKAVEVDPDFAKQWHVATHINKWRTKHFGDYPQTTLHYARRYRDTANKLLNKRKYPFSKKNNIEAMIDCIYDDENDVPIPAWMAQALADGFKHYYSKRFLHNKQDTTLDAVFGIEGTKTYNEFSPFSVSNRTLVEEAREIQWYCNLKFATALNFAVRKIESEYDAKGDGKDIYKFTHAEIRTICQDESRGKYPSFGAWCEDKGYSFLANFSSREDFLSFVKAFNSELGADIETAMKDPHKRLIADFA